MASTNIDIKTAQLDVLDIQELTTKQLNGTGVFDVLMSTSSIHIKEEYDKGRIRGQEYAQVYLGAMQAVLATSVEYLNRSKLLGIEIANQEKQGLLIEAQTALTEAQANQVIQETTLKLPAEIANINASTALSDANKDRVVEELTLIPLQGNLLTAQTTQVGAETTLTNKRVDQLTQELAKIPVEVQLLESQVLTQNAQNQLIAAQTEGVTLQNTKVPKEILLLDKQALQADGSIALTTAQKEQIVAETTTRLPVEVQNLVKQVEQTKRYPYDIEEIQARIANMTKQTLIAEKDIELKEGQLSLQEKQLLLAQAELAVKQQELQVQLAAIDSQRAQAQLYTQKVQTEKAQTEGTIAQPGSVLGANVAVLMAQADGYKSDKLQKAAKILVDTWNVRRNSDDGTEANVANQLHDANVGVTVKGMLIDAGLTPNTTG